MYSEKYKERRTNFKNQCARVPICFCIDTSVSMATKEDESIKLIRQNGRILRIEGESCEEIYSDQLYKETPIGKVNEALKSFYRNILMDEDAIRACETATIVFDKEARLWENFSPCDKEKDKHCYTIEINESASGEYDSNLVPAIEMAIDMVLDQKSFYRKKHIKSHRPIIVLMTDAKATDETSAIRRRLFEMQQSHDENGNVRNDRIYFYAVALNKESEDELKKYVTKDKYLIKAADMKNLVEFLDKLSRSVSASPEEQYRILDELDF